MEPTVEPTMPQTDTVLPSTKALAERMLHDYVQQLGLPEPWPRAVEPVLRLLIRTNRWNFLWIVQNL